MKFWQRLLFVIKFWRSIPFIFDYFRSKEVALWKKLLPIILIAGYFMLPFDLVSDFLAIIGFVDDFAVMTLILQVLIQAAPLSLVEKHKFHR